jgi:hypothetical protein
MDTPDRSRDIAGGFACCSARSDEEAVRVDDYRRGLKWGSEASCHAGSRFYCNRQWGSEASCHAGSGKGVVPKVKWLARLEPPSVVSTL